MRVSSFGRFRTASTYLGWVLTLRRTQAFYCRWDSISKGQSCFKLLRARVRLPQTSLMRSEDRSVSQAIPCHLLLQATAAESHPDPIGSTQKVGSTTLRSFRPVRYWLTDRSNIVRSAKDLSSGFLCVRCLKGCYALSQSMPVEALAVYRVPCAA